jgi:uncharacterized protein
VELAAAHLPHQALIDAYGKGGFRFAGLSHRGSLLCLPDGIWAWPVEAPAAITDEVLAPVLVRAEQLDYFLIGTGELPWAMPEALRAPFRAAGISLDAMMTAPAVRTYNVLLMENRRVGAALIAVE